MALPKKVELYPITPEFERVLLWMCCSSPRFWRRVGHALDPESMPSPVGKLVIEAVRAIVADTDQGPSATLTVIQRLRRWQHEGRVSSEQVLEVHDLLDAAEDLGLPSEDSVVAEVAPILRRLLQRDAVTTVMADFAAKGDFSKAVQLIAKADRLGAVEDGLGVRLCQGSGASFAAIERVRNLQRLPLGILDLDNLIGGLPREQLLVFIGGPGAGKSMALSHMAASALPNGLLVGYATLELSDVEVLCRIKANLMGIPIDTVKTGSDDVKKRWEERLDASFGACVVRSFTAGVTTVQDLIAWVAVCEDHEGRTMDLLLVDYADKLCAPYKNKDKDRGYLAMAEVYESLRTFAIERRIWCATASQSGRSSKDQKKKVDLEHVADSMHKVRVADMVITLNDRDDGEQLLFYVAKNRTGKSRFEVGPLPCDFACGAIAPVFWGQQPALDLFPGMPMPS